MLTHLESTEVFRAVRRAYLAAKAAESEQDQKTILSLAEDIARALQKENVCFNREYHLSIVTGEPYDPQAPLGSPRSPSGVLQFRR